MQFESKDDIRRYVYKKLMEYGVAKPPFPIEGRIPNFQGADEAAERMLDIREFVDAKVVKINPDSPQRPVRLLSLNMGKLVVMPTPRIKRGFLVLDPSLIRNLYFASTIKGAFRLGKIVDMKDLPHIDFIVEGSVAVSKDGARLGKGEGYAELEYAILLEFGKIEYDIKIATTVHPIQIVDNIPVDDYDVSIDYIVTPKEIIRCEKFFRPKGILWERLTEEKIDEIPLLKEMYRQRF